MYADGGRLKLAGSKALIFLLLLSAVLRAKADDLAVELVRSNDAPEVITSVAQLDARVGDMLHLRSEYGDVYQFDVASARRSALGNKIISGNNKAGARLTLVVTSDGVVQGSVRDAGQTFRITNSADEFAWYAETPTWPSLPMRAQQTGRTATMQSKWIIVS